MTAPFFGHTTTKANADLDALWSGKQDALSIPSALLAPNAAKGDGVTDDSANLAAKSATLAATGGVLFMPQVTYRIGQNTTLGCAIQMAPGAKCKLDANVTLVLNGPLTLPFMQCFDCSAVGSKVVFGVLTVAEVFPEWFGAKKDSITDDYNAVRLSVATTHQRIRMTAGRWTFGDGEGVTVNPYQKIVCDGEGATYISGSNAYAFASPSAGNCDGVEITGFTYIMRVGSTTGGAVKALSNIYHSGWRLRNLSATGQTGCADPLFYLDGFIGSSAVECDAIQAQIGFKLSCDGFATNAALLLRCTATSCTVKGMWLSLGGLNVIEGGVVESCTGIPIHIDGSASAQVKGVWFEDNSRGLLVSGTANQAKITKCRFHYHHAGSTDPHMVLTGPGGGSDLIGVQIMNNEFVDASGSGTDITIDAATAGTMMSRNRWHNNVAPVTDLGTGTLYLDNDVQTGASPTPNRVNGFWEAGYDPFFDTKHPTLPLRKRVGQNTDLVAIYDTDSVTLLAHIDQNGMGVFSANSVAIKSKAAAVPNDGDVTANSLRGGILMLDDNGASSRLYIRCGDGVWRYATLT